MSHQTLSLIATTAREKQSKKSLVFMSFLRGGGLTYYYWLFCFFKQPLFFFLNGLNYLLWSAVNLSYVAIYDDRCCYYWQKVLIMVIFWLKTSLTGTYLVEGEAESSPRHFISYFVGWITRYCTNLVWQLFLYVSELIIAVNDEDVFVFWFWSKFS